MHSWTRWIRIEAWWHRGNLDNQLPQCDRPRSRKMEKGADSLSRLSASGGLVRSPRTNHAKWLEYYRDWRLGAGGLLDLEIARGRDGCWGQSMLRDVLVCPDVLGDVGVSRGLWAPEWKQRCHYPKGRSSGESRPSYLEMQICRHAWIERLHPYL